MGAKPDTQEKCRQKENGDIYGFLMDTEPGVVVVRI